MVPCRRWLPLYKVLRSPNEPYLLENVLIRHPRLRVSMMHHRSPLLDEMIAISDPIPSCTWTSAAYSGSTREPTFTNSSGIIDAGFGKRVMFFGSEVTTAAASARSRKTVSVE